MSAPSLVITILAAVAARRVAVIAACGPHWRVCPVDVRPE